MIGPPGDKRLWRPPAACWSKCQAAILARRAPSDGPGVEAVQRRTAGHPTSPSYGPTGSSYLWGPTRSGQPLSEPQLVGTQWGSSSVKQLGRRSGALVWTQHRLRDLEKVLQSFNPAPQKFFSVTLPLLASQQKSVNPSSFKESSLGTRQPAALLGMEHVCGGHWVEVSGDATRRWPLCMEFVVAPLQKDRRYKRPGRGNGCPERAHLRCVSHPLRSRRPLPTRNVYTTGLSLNMSYFVSLFIGWVEKMPSGSSFGVKPPEHSKLYCIIVLQQGRGTPSFQTTFCSYLRKYAHNKSYRKSIQRRVPLGKNNDFTMLFTPPCHTATSRRMDVPSAPCAASNRSRAPLAARRPREAARRTLWRKDRGKRGGAVVSLDSNFAQESLPCSQTLGTW